MNQYIAELHKASEHCGFAEKLDEYLRDRFVCGLNCEKIQQRLLSEENLDLAKALKIAMDLSRQVGKPKTYRVKVAMRQSIT